MGSYLDRRRIRGPSGRAPAPSQVAREASHELRQELASGPSWVSGGLVVSLVIRSRLGRMPGRREQAQDRRERQLRGWCVPRQRGRC